MTSLANFTNIIRKTAESTPHIEGPGEFAVDVVGESHYHDNLNEIAGPKTIHSVNKHFSARLIPESTNPHDNCGLSQQDDGARISNAAGGGGNR